MARGRSTLAEVYSWLTKTAPQGRFWFSAHPPARAKGEWLLAFIVVDAIEQLFSAIIAIARRVAGWHFAIAHAVSAQAELAAIELDDAKAGFVGHSAIVVGVIGQLAHIPVAVARELPSRWRDQIPHALLATTAITGFDLMAVAGGIGGFQALILMHMAGQ